MSFTIATNIFSLRALNDLSKTNARLQQAHERIASGLRIRKASDDPGGLALADTLRRDSKLASVALRNAGDGLSLVRINDKALEEIQNILTRMAELAEQSSNTTITNTQRSTLSSEFIALGSEINRIAKTTNFNNINMLSAGQGASIQVGFNSFSTSQIQVGGVQGDLNALSLGNDNDSLNYSIIDNSQELSVAAARTALAAVQSAMEDVSVKRGMLGADESRLSHAIDHLEVAKTNFISAESKIRDVDTAQELAIIVREQIIQDAAVAVLAQANQQPQQVLELLKMDGGEARKSLKEFTESLINDKTNSDITSIKSK